MQYNLSPPHHQAGFVSIVGRPNVGKSTLLNALIGEKLAIVSPKVQTTRKAFFGILNHENYQIVFVDTPGIIQPKYKLHEVMMNYVANALQDVEVVLWLTEPIPHPDETEVLLKIQKSNTPLVIAINKIDNFPKETVAQRLEWIENHLKPQSLIPISALHKLYTYELVHTLLKYIPESPPFFDKDQLSDMPERFFIAEMIREKIFLFTHEEIPYASEVSVLKIDHLPHIIHIEAEIFVAKKRHKPIIIGHKGKMLQKIGTEARKDIEKFLNHKVFLNLFVKVSEEWNKDTTKLRYFGYDDFK